MSLEPILIGFIAGLVGRDVWSLLIGHGGGDDGSGGSRSKPRKRR
ncbi:hypothetical protein [Archangium sp.]|jgi:hypothetical protein